MLKELASMLYAMHQISKRVYLPTGLTLSASNPERELMLTLRNSALIGEKYGPYKLSKAPLAVEIPQLCKRFVLREVKHTLKGTQIDQIKTCIKEEISLAFKNLNLRLVGGYKDASSKKLDLLYFKEEARELKADEEVEVQMSLINLTSAQWGLNDSQRTQIEESIENEKIENDGVL